MKPTPFDLPRAACSCDEGSAGGGLCLMRATAGCGGARRSRWKSSGCRAGRPASSSTCAHKQSRGAPKEVCRPTRSCCTGGMAPPIPRRTAFDRRLEWPVLEDYIARAPLRRLISSTLRGLLRVDPAAADGPSCGPTTIRWVRTRTASRTWRPAGESSNLTPAAAPNSSARAGRGTFAHGLVHRDTTNK